MAPGAAAVVATPIGDGGEGITNSSNSNIGHQKTGSGSSRIPQSLQAIFLASNGGNEDVEPPTSKQCLRDFLGRKHSASKKNNKNGGGCSLFIMGDANVAKNKPNSKKNVTKVRLFHRTYILKIQKAFCIYTFLTTMFFLGIRNVLFYFIFYFFHQSYKD